MALFREVAELAEALAAEPGRLRKRAAIAASVARVAEESAGQAGLFCLYLAGQPFAEADPRKLNAGGALLTRALQAVSGCTQAALSAAFRRHGDLGAAAAEVWPAADAEAPSAEGALALNDVETAFAAMAAAATTARRAALVEGLLRRSSTLEAKYLLKLMLGDMRIGVKQSLIEEAMAVAAAAELSAVRHAVMLEADLARVARMAFAGTLGEARMRLFHPLGFMLASPVETPEEAVARFAPPQPAKKVARSQRQTGAPQPAEAFAELSAPAAVEERDAAAEGFAEEVLAAAAAPAGPVHAFLEDKYDGMRAQLHCGDPEQPGRVALYSRNREEITESFPEIVEAFASVTEPLILDGELLGWDLASERALPFSILGQRIGRKRVDNAMRRQIPVLFMAFDLLYERGELLLALPLAERRRRLEAVAARLAPAAVSPLERPAERKAQRGLFEEMEAADSTPEPVPSHRHAVEVARLRLSPARLVESAEAIDVAYGEARARANEGVMIKAADSAYLPGRRGLAWVKLKRELATLDVVITGAEFGHGRRAGLLSDYTFAVRGPAADGMPATLLNVGKAYSGVTDAEIAELTEWMKAHTLEDFGHFRTVEPLRVIEVAFNNVMRSERHASGFALRFPRILRLRDDKSVEEIDTLAQVEAVFQSQPDKGSE